MAFYRIKSYLSLSYIKAALITVLLFLFIANPVFAQENDFEAEPEINVSYASGKVLEIISETSNKELEESFDMEQTVQLAKVFVLNGKYRGKVVEIENQLTSNPIYDINIKKDSRVILNIEEHGKEVIFYIADLDRTPVLFILVGTFLALLMIIGGMQGLRAIASLVITSFLIFFMLIPAILESAPVIPATVVVALISTFATMFMVTGVNKKSLSASLGTVFSVMIAGFLSSMVIKFAPLNGFGSHESAMLWASRPDLDFTGILTAGVIIASLGAVMDVGMSIASSISEFKKVNSHLSVKELFSSGLNVGKDIMGTMSNTLIMAYIGGAFTLVLVAADAPLIKLVNLNAIAAEITSALAGSIGIVLCVPITAIITAYLIGKENISVQNDSEKNIEV